MKLASLLQESLKLKPILLSLVFLGFILYWPAADASSENHDINTLIMLWLGAGATAGLGGYVIFGAIFGVWVKRWTITRIQIIRYFFKTGERVSKEHKHQEIITWCNENTPGFIHVVPRRARDIDMASETGHFFFKKKKDRLFFKMVWG